MNLLTGDLWTLYVADCREAMAAMPERSVHCVVSSPPYWGLRDYGIPPVDWQDGERCVFGLEKTIAAYIRHTIEIFDGLRRVLRDDGVIWWNVGDSYCQYNANRGPSKSLQNDAAGYPALASGARENYPLGSKLLIPHRVAIALQDSGWCVRQDNVWAKRSPMPESVSGWRWVRCAVKTQNGVTGGHGKQGVHENRTVAGFNERYFDGAGAKFLPCPGCPKCESTGGFILRRGSWRTTNAHEYVFQITKGGEYFSDGDAVAEATTGNAHSRGTGVNPKASGGIVGVEKQNGSFSAAVAKIVETRNPRSVWSLSNEPFKGAHFATFPTAIPRRCIEASTSKAGCCPACGAQYAPVVESSRVPTRPGVNSKIELYDRNKAMNAELSYGNRDPQRHVAITTVSAYLPTCTCNAGPPVPAVVFDPFNGSGTTGQVAVSLGRRYVGCEINETYARELAAVRIETPLPERKSRKAPRQRRSSDKMQRSLFAGEGRS